MCLKIHNIYFTTYQSGPKYVQSLLFDYFDLPLVSNLNYVYCSVVVKMAYL